MKYIEVFGTEETLPLFQLPPDMTTDEFQIEIYERCLAEGKPVRAFVDMNFDPDVIY